MSNDREVKINVTQLHKDKCAGVYSRCANPACGTLFLPPPAPHTRDQCTRCAGWACGECGRSKTPEHETCGRVSCKRRATMARSRKRVVEIVTQQPSAINGIIETQRSAVECSGQEPARSVSQLPLTFSPSRKLLNRRRHGV